MTSRTRPAHAVRIAAPEAEAKPWMGEGILAGVTGAAVVAAFFGVIDLAAGRPLWTPDESRDADPPGPPAPPNPTNPPAPAPDRA